MRQGIVGCAAVALCCMIGVAWATALPQVNIITLSSSIPHAALFGLSFDAGKGVAVGAGGMIYESDNAGANWKPNLQTETQLALLAVDRNGVHTIAVGQMGAVLVEDSPGVWKKYDSGQEHRLLTVSVNSSGLTIAAGEFGTVVKSSDGGHTWTASAPDWASMADKDTFGTGEPTIYAAHVSETGEVTIAGEFGVIMRSPDAGTTWHAVRPIQSKAPTIFAMQIVLKGAGNSYAVGQTGELLVSGDGGTAWEERKSITQANYLGVAAAKDGDVVITGMRVMVHSRDAGATWSFLNNSDTTTEWYQAVRAEQTTGHILAVGHSGRIIQIGG
ncbi:MAG: hypothetical protein JWR07_3295 [Nevskia sp.]|nr:hypothetical protein [Nevskia sp.]